MMRALRFLLLGCTLLWTQLALAGHGIDHALQLHDEACLECLALPGFAAVPVFPPQPFVPRVTQAGEPAAVLPAPTFPAPPAFHSRAPPVLQSA